MPMKYVLIIFLFIAELQSVCDFGPVSKKIGRVDVVYTWVDGADPLWKLSLRETILGHKHHLPSEALAKSRFRNHDELKYSLRSLWKHAAFVNHIYIVTFGQKPKWLKAHPKITIVDHQEIFTDQADLPTFNSQAIEANLHHIPNLKECYVYFNDDVFLGDDAIARDFFSENGSPKFFIASWDAPEGQIMASDDTLNASWKNTNTLLNRLFGYKKRKALEHAPFAFRKSQQMALERCFQPVFKKVSGHAFRSSHDFVITNGFSQYLLNEYGLAKRSKIQCLVVGLKDNLEANKQELEAVMRVRPRTFCIEDDMTDDNAEQEIILNAFFEAYFPEKAPWEI